MELQSDQGARYATADSNGWFVFDGVAPGDYKLSAYGRGFPDIVKRLGPARVVRMKAKGCVNQVVSIPRAGP